MSNRQVQNVMVYEQGIECTPDYIFKAFAGCFGLFTSALIVAALGTAAGGVFWTAQNMYKLTDGSSSIIYNVQPYSA